MLFRSHIMDYKFDNFVWSEYIQACDIEFVSIPYSEFIVEHDSEKVEVILPTVHQETSEDGKVSFLLLLGSSLILLGVLVSIIMLYQ